MSTARVMDARSLIATDEATQEAGLIIWYRMLGDASLEDLRDAWISRGLEEQRLPSPPGAIGALTRALREHCAGTSVLVRRLAQKARAVVNETIKGDELSYETTLRASLDDVGRPVFDPPDHPAAGAVRASYGYHLETLSPADVGSWLVDLVEHHDGVRLRDTGGVYFVPATRVAAWKTATEAIHAATGHRINSVPALKAADAVASILDAVISEATQAATDLAEELEAADLTARKASTRAERCEAAKGKVERYEVLLGAKADEIRKRLDHLRAAFAAKALFEQAQEDAEREARRA